MIENFLIGLILVGFIPVLYLVYLLIKVENLPEPKKVKPKVTFDGFYDDTGFEEVRLPKK